MLPKKPKNQNKTSRQTDIIAVLCLSRIMCALLLYTYITKAGYTSGFFSKWKYAQRFLASLFVKNRKN
jgi:hypothetical protein